MARRSKEDSAATAAAVRSAALELFAAHGYAEVGLERIARAAGVTRGAVYHHYGSKERLFAEVLAQTHVQIGTVVAEAAERAAADGGDAWAWFEAGCRAFLHASTEPAVCRIMLLDGPAVVGWTAWRDVDAAASGRHLADALDELASDGLLIDVSLGAAGALLSGAMNEAALWVASQPAERRQRALEEAWQALRVLLTGLRKDARN